MSISKQKNSVVYKNSKPTLTYCEQFLSNFFIEVTDNLKFV